MYVYLLVRKTVKEAERTIDDLLDSAIKLFIKHGYSAVTLEQIAAGIGMTRGAFYHHFHSKEDILNALIRRERHSFEDKLEELFNVKKQPAVKMKLILDHILSNFFENKRFNRFIHFTWFRIEAGQIQNKFLYQGATNEKLNQEFTKIIRKGQSDGSFSKDVPAAVLALRLTASILGMYRLHFQLKKGLDKKRGKAMLYGIAGIN
jgi:AcrR family transcriptional regulator